ncbi:MAG: T9SS type A sorting domain-containing protein [Bacteroidetes bacterium]|nr:T9SS type A sorting domain-containing protein [Bacteroidota bacterium]
MIRIVFSTVLYCCVVTLTFAQQSPISNYVDEFRGDTAVVKEGKLYEAITYDTTNVPPGRVYLLKKNGTYPLGSNPTTKAGRHTVIVGEIPGPPVLNNNPDAFPVICGSGGNSGQINYGGDITVKNCMVVPASATGTLGWVFFWGSAPNSRVVLENCIFERTRWVIVGSNAVPGTRLYIRDCYFVNLSGQACRRNGGVYDNVDNNTDTIWVENNTHVMAQGMMYKFRNYPIKKLMFNHNTFINCAGIIFETNGYQSNWAVVNNIFINSNVQPFCFIAEDYPEVDPDTLPLGLINVAPLPTSYEQVPRKILVDRNLVFWDSRLTNLAAEQIAANVNNTTKWYNQTIKMNSRTKAMFDNNAQYPYLVEGTWYEKCPTFVNPQDLLTTQVDNIKKFAKETMDLTKAAILPDWRVLGGTEYYVYPDWPIPVNLSYTDADLQKAAFGGFPLGDLNWFPAKKVQWLVQRNAEYAAIEAALNAGQPLSVDRNDFVATDFLVEQNYPNPFNPTTTITFTLNKPGNVVIKVYNVLGQEVATLLNAFKDAATHSVEFIATNLPSGLYIYTVNFSGKSISRKMLLMK